MENPYQPGLIADLPQANLDHSKQLHDPSFVVPLYKASRILKVVGFLALINIVPVILLPVYTTSLNTDGPNPYYEQTLNPVISVINVGILGLFAFCVLYRPFWGRGIGFLYAFLILLSAIINLTYTRDLPLLIWEVLIGGFTFFALWRGEQLFGSNGFSHKQLCDAKEAIERGLTPI